MGKQKSLAELTNLTETDVKQLQDKLQITKLIDCSARTSECGGSDATK